MLVTLENNRNMTQNRKRNETKMFAANDKTLHRITRAIYRPGPPSSVGNGSFAPSPLSRLFGWATSDDYTLPLLYLPPLALHTLPEGEVEDILDTFARLSAALNVLCANLLCDGSALFGRNGRESLCREHALCVLVGTQINLGPHQQKRGPLTEVVDLRMPLPGPE